MPEYSRDQLWELYESLPKELKEAVFSEKNADKIYEVCTRNGISDDKMISQVAKNITYSLLGLLPPDELALKLEKDVKIKKETAKNLAIGIDRFIFLPIKPILEKLYQIGFKKPGNEEISEKAPVAVKEDTYREPVE